jgi:hypothetical protein
MEMVSIMESMKITDALILRIQKIDSGTTLVHIALGAHQKEGADVLLSNACRCAADLREEADRLILQLDRMKSESEKIDWKGISKRH